MNLNPFTGPGSTPSRRRFWDAITSAVVTKQKVAGRNVTVDEHPGKGTVINVEMSARRTGGGGGLTGACCASGECSVISSSACSDLGGDYLGDGTTCDSIDCTQGACCFPNADCSVMTAGDCGTAGGIFQGYGTVCDPSPCSCYPGSEIITFNCLTPLFFDPPTSLFTVTETRTYNSDCSYTVEYSCAPYGCDAVCELCGGVGSSCFNTESDSCPRCEH